MFKHVLPALLCCLPFAFSAFAGDDTPTTRLKSLQARVAKREFQTDQLRRDLLAFCREHVGTPLYAKAIDALAQTPSPLDRLDAKDIDEDDRKALAIPELVGYLRPHHRAIASVAISFDGTLLASSGWDNTVHLYKLGGKEPKSWAKLDASLSGIAFSPDGKLLATGCGDTRVLLWDLTGAQPKLKHKLAGHENRPFSAAFSPNGKMFASGSYDPILRIWKLEEGELEQWAALANEDAPSRALASLAFSHNGQFIVSGSHLGKETLRIWDAAGNFLDDKTPPDTRARIVACSPTEPILAFAGDDAKIHLWNLGGANVEKLRQLAGHSGKEFGPLVKALAFSPNGKIVASSGQDKYVRLWNVASGEKAHEWHFKDEARALAFSSDGRHLAVGNSDGTLYLLRLESAKLNEK
jgi:WD40 repeat protein